MQIVRDLAGYTLGRSDTLRRAMSKKKAAVMEKERKYFVYGNPEENVAGCIQNGIDEKTANYIYDEMIDFAKYAFNKSHAAAYAVVSYQTAYLKYYYPVEFMAALVTSVIDAPAKVSRYIFTCRQMGIQILRPDINESQAVFTVSGKNIRYGLTAVKSIGRNVVDEIIKEREENGIYIGLEDFITRVGDKEINKRIIENLIKAGAFDGVPGTRKQKLAVYASMLDQMLQERKKSIEGQMTLFDFADEEEKKSYEISFPPIGEFSQDVLLGFEKEVIGFYISGHPLDAYVEKWKKNITARTMDFMHDDEESEAEVRDGEKVWIGGMINSVSSKVTKNNKVMAFFIIEDLVGTVEVVLFPKDYEKNHALLSIDAKVFVYGRVSINEEEQGKLICEKIIPFDEVPKELWIQFQNRTEYETKREAAFEIMRESDGNDRVIFYLAEEKAKKILPPSKNVNINEKLVKKLQSLFSEENIKVVDKTIEINAKMR